jgi:hypothetical protein
MPSINDWKSIGLTPKEREELKRWRNGWGNRLWREELERLCRGEDKAIDDLWCHDREVLRSAGRKIHLPNPLHRD